MDIAGQVIPAITSNNYIDIDTKENLGGDGIVIFQRLQTSVFVISPYFSSGTKTWHIRVSNTTGTITTIKN